MENRVSEKKAVYGRLKNFVIDQKLDQRLCRTAKNEKCSVSALIRRCCHEALDARERNSKTTNP